MSANTKAASPIGVLEFQSVLVLSTAHLNITTLGEINRWENSKPWDSSHWIEKLRIAEHHYGFLIFVRDDDIHADTPECLANCIRFAAALNVQWINFDCDGSKAPGLQVYDH